MNPPRHQAKPPFLTTPCGAWGLAGVAGFGRFVGSNTKTSATTTASGVLGSSVFPRWLGRFAKTTNELSSTPSPRARQDRHFRAAVVRRWVGDLDRLMAEEMIDHFAPLRSGPLADRLRSFLDEVMYWLQPFCRVCQLLSM